MSSLKTNVSKHNVNSFYQKGFKGGAPLPGPIKLLSYVLKEVHLQSPLREGLVGRILGERFCRIPRLIFHLLQPQYPGSLCLLLVTEEDG